MNNGHQTLAHHANIMETMFQHMVTELIHLMKS